MVDKERVRKRVCGECEKSTLIHRDVESSTVYGALAPEKDFNNSKW